MNDKELMRILKAQHDNLKRLLTQTKAEAEKLQPDYEKIQNTLLEFKGRLLEHLLLENGTFYPRVFAKLSSKNEEVESAKEFMKSMVAIEAVVFAFFDKYLPDKVKNKFSAFLGNLDFMIRSLMLRIESEEEGIYLYLA